MSSEYDFTMVEGNTPTIRFSAVDEDGAPVPLTGLAIRWAFSAYSPTSGLFDSTIIKTKTVGDGIVVIDEAGGVFDVTPAVDDTQGIPGAYYHEAKLTNATPFALTSEGGRMTVKPGLIT